MNKVERKREMAKIKLEDIPLDDKQSYDLIGEGLNLGIFQLDSPLSMVWSKKLKPKNIEEMSELTSLVRPGCLDSELTSLYKEIKVDGRAVEYLHEDLRPILESTNGVLVYQEQVMKIAEQIAGFDLKEADSLRKAVGKKLPEEMAKLKDRFISGCINKGYDEELGNKLFDYIEKFADYGFNKSHANCYSITGYYTAYLKTHYPLAFYLAMLRYADKAIDTDREVTDIINDARLRGINVILPDLSTGNIEFEKSGKNIAFGLGHIKGIGEASHSDLIELSKCESFTIFIKKCLELGTNKRTVEALIGSGATKNYNIDRCKQRAFFEAVNSLSNKESSILLSSICNNPQNDIMWHIENPVYNGAMKNRKPKIDVIINGLKDNKQRDSLHSILALEKKYLGVSISGSESELYDNPRVNASCVEVLTKGPGERFNLGVIIVEAVEKVIKRGNNKGKKMMFLRLEDYSYVINGAMVFGELLEEKKELFYDGSAVLASCYLSKDKALIVEGVEEL